MCACTTYRWKRSEKSVEIHLLQPGIGGGSGVSCAFHSRYDFSSVLLFNLTAHSPYVAVDVEYSRDKKNLKINVSQKKERRWKPDLSSKESRSLIRSSTCVQKRTEMRAMKTERKREKMKKKDHVITMCGMTLWHLLNTKQQKKQHSTMFYVVNLFFSVSVCFSLPLPQNDDHVDNNNLMKYKIDNKETLKTLFHSIGHNVNMNLFHRRVKTDLSVAIQFGRWSCDEPRSPIEWPTLLICREWICVLAALKANPQQMRGTWTFDSSSRDKYSDINNL